jgi:hypothetical protein
MAKATPHKLVRTVFRAAFCEANGQVFEVIVPTGDLNRRLGLRRPSRYVLGSGSTRRQAWQDAYQRSYLLIQAAAE